MTAAGSITRAASGPSCRGRTAGWLGQSAALLLAAVVAGIAIASREAVGSRGAATAAVAVANNLFAR